MEKPSLWILLVDDDEEDVAAIRKIISGSSNIHFTLDAASSYADGLTAMRSNLYDGYLVDHHLAGKKNGLALLKEAMENGCKGPIIILTDESEQKIDLAALEAGAADYLVKSQITAQLFERAMRYAVRHKQTELSLRETENKYRTLVALSSAMGIASKRAELSPILIEQLLDLLQANSAALLTYDHHQKDAIVEKGGGYWSALTGTRLPLREYLITQPLETGQPFTFDEINGETQKFTPGSNANILAVIGVPLITPKETTGALIVGREKDWSSEELSTLQSIGNMVTNAFQRLGLYEDTLHHATQLTLINELGRILPGIVDPPELFEKLSDTIHRLLADIDSLTITLNDPTGRELSVAYLVRSGARQDLGRLPVIPLKNIEFDTLREVILARKSFIVQGLPFAPKTQNLPRETESQPGVQKSSLYVPMLGKASVIGVLQIQSLTPNRFDQDDIELLTLVANTAAVAIENIRLFDEAQLSHQELEQTYDATLEGWAQALELRDLETAGHTERVTDLTIWLASMLGFKSEELIHIRRGAIMHDIGKMGIPDNILLKPGALTPEEWVIMRQHPVYGINLLAPIKFLHPAMNIVLYHHEKWDGSGYPKGLKGEEIPLDARIFAIVDVWDALRNVRLYKKAWSKEETMRYIIDQSGKHFDPKVVQAFIEMINRIQPGE